MGIYKLVAELTVIILGVLIALGVDAWWERIQNEQLELQVLSSLQTDLAAVEGLVNALAKRDLRIIERANQLTNTEPMPFHDQRTGDLAKLFATVPRDLRLRTYDELHNTGNLQVISNRDLRLLLTDFDALARTLAGYDKQMEVQWNETARPILYRTYSFDQIQLEGESRPRRQAPIEASELDLFELRNAIIDRGNFAAVHLHITQDLSELLKQLQGQTTAAFEAVQI